MRPVIAVTSAIDDEVGYVRIQLRESYTGAVQGAGGAPLVLPATAKVDGIADALSRVDGVVLSGGVDIDPSFFDEEPHPKIGSVNLDWDTHDIAVARYCLAAKIPILGICRGVQVLNVAAGGSLYQDIGSQVPGSIKHALKTPRWQPGHTITIAKGSMLHKIVGVETLSVNSFHHQSVARVAQGFTASSWAADGIVETIECNSHPFALGVQWHPEGMWERYDIQQRLFAALVAAAKEYRQGVMKNG